jgi:ferritin-like metal-binding protein YciE
MRTLKDLFLDELADRYDSERRLVIAMPKMIKAATCPNLRKVLETHLMETERQVAKVEKVFKLFGKKPSTKKCEATIGLVTEAAEAISDNKGSPMLNVALICAAEKIEHYEIASYGCLSEWAAELRNVLGAAMLRDLLAEETAANYALKEVARTSTTLLAKSDGCPDGTCVTGKKAKPAKRAA